MNIEINRNYLFGSALGGFFGYMVSSQLIFFHPSQAFWLVGFGGVGGYAIAESADLKKQREKSWRDNPHVQIVVEGVKKNTELSLEMTSILTELQSRLQEEKAEQSVEGGEP